MIARSKISVITVCYNSEKYIEQTIKSVVGQTYENIEYIIVDGGSTDGTIDIIKKYETSLNKWISEPDEGIAHAMNKGMDLVTGDFILFLHSDDYLMNSRVLEKAAPYLNSMYDIVAFDILFEDGGKKTLARPRGFNWWFNFKTGLFHQSTLCSRKLFEKIGIFDTNFKIAMDYDFFLRAYKSGAKLQYINMPLSVMRLVGISSRRNWHDLKKRFREERRVHLLNCSSIQMRIIYHIYWAIYFPYGLIFHTAKSGKR